MVASKILYMRFHMRVLTDPSDPAIANGIERVTFEKFHMYKGYIPIPDTHLKCKRRT